MALPFLCNVQPEILNFDDDKKLHLSSVRNNSAGSEIDE